MSRKPRTRRRPPARPAQPTSQVSSPLVPQSPALPRLLTVGEVAKVLRTSPKAIYAMVQRSGLPGVVRISRRLLVDEKSLLHWLDQKRGVSLTSEGEQR